MINNLSFEGEGFPFRDNPEAIARLRGLVEVLDQGLNDVFMEMAKGFIEDPRISNVMREIREMGIVPSLTGVAFTVDLTPNESIAPIILNGAEIVMHTETDDEPGLVLDRQDLRFLKALKISAR